jgi:3-isopropylmalate/(R)-2-methylmalate dehydratase large subunit
MGRTLLDKLWDLHTVEDLGDGWSLLHIDRHLLHDLSGPSGLAAAKARGLPLHSPQLVFAVPDHAISSAPGRTGETFIDGARFYRALREGSNEHGFRFFDIGESGQGIVHVMAPEQGIVLPGMSVVCGDSHTCTNGALGALAFGIGSSEGVHVLVTQTLRQRRPKNMRVRFDGRLQPGVEPKDLVLHMIRTLGAAAGTGHAIEYAGEAIAAMSMEGRLTLCNLSVEMGARFGMVAPDATTIDWVRGRRFAPQGAMFEQAVAQWRELHSDPDAHFDREEVIDASQVVPTITWGVSPQHGMPVDGRVPDPLNAPPAERATLQSALDYMGLVANQPIAGTPVDWVFIGSCTNSRLSDLRAAAAVVRGRRIAAHVTAWVVPGSVDVQRAAEAEGLADIFRAAGFDWREPGCAMCVAANGEVVPPGQRAVSTTNRNFVGRQGPGARTHLASPSMAAAAAVAGAITDVRSL